MKALCGTPTGMQDLLMLSRCKGISVTGVINGKIIFIAGVNCTIPNVGTGWMLTSPLAEKYSKFLYIGCKNTIDRAIAGFELHRVQSTVLTDNIKAAKWLELLGLKREALFRKADSKANDYYIYSKVI